MFPLLRVQELACYIHTSRKGNIAAKISLDIDMGYTFDVMVQSGFIPYNRIIHGSFKDRYARILLNKYKRRWVRLNLKKLRVVDKKLTN